MDRDNPLEDVPRAGQRDRESTQRTEMPTHIRPGEPPVVKQPDHSMFEEEPMGEDQVPLDIHNPQQKRHSRKEGKGGLADPGDSWRARHNEKAE